MIEFKTYEEAEQYCEDNASYWDCGCGCGQYSEVRYEVEDIHVVCTHFEQDMYCNVEEDEEVIGIIIQ